MFIEEERMVHYEIMRELEATVIALKIKMDDFLENDKQVRNLSSIYLLIRCHGCCFLKFCIYDDLGTLKDKLCCNIKEVFIPCSIC
jgi:hypothetical protein